MITTMTVKLYPTATQESELFRYLTAGRRTYNHFLEHRIKIWKRRKESTTYQNQCAMLTKWRENCAAAKSIPLRVQRDAIRRLDLAYKSFFRRCKSEVGGGHPRFKGRRQWHSFEILEIAKYVCDGRIRVPRLGMITCRGLREFDGKQRALRIVHRASGWHAQLLIDDGKMAPEKRPIESLVGIDVGLKEFTVDSHGTMTKPPRHFRKLERRLAHLQRSVSRKPMGSANRRKAIAKLRRLYQCVVDSRSDFTHKLSKLYVEGYDLIAVEKLNIAGMVKGRLSKSILDAAWGQFIAQLTYKAENAGVTFVAVNPRGTSQDCSQCGQTVPKDLSERVHRCDCGCVLDRDLNAARNILTRALKVLSSAGRADKACGERRRSAKQEVLV